MAPIKFEENIKDKLEKRTLSPAANSWSKLSERLEADEKKSRNPIFWWLSIAAGLIIMIAVSAHFFKSNTIQNELPQMVNDDEKQEQLEIKTPKPENTKAIELVVEDNENDLPAVENSKIIDSKKTTEKKQKTKIQLAENGAPIQKQEKLKRDELNKDLKSITNKTLMKEAVANAINDIKSENTSVTDREIDSLLKVASKELFKDKLQKETSKMVDANALLSSVEDEMGQSFRSKVFEALKESYETVKTSLAERNN